MRQWRPFGYGCSWKRPLEPGPAGKKGLTYVEGHVVLVGIEEPGGGLVAKDVFGFVGERVINVHATRFDMRDGAAFSSDGWRGVQNFGKGKLKAVNARDVQHLLLPAKGRKKR